MTTTETPLPMIHIFPRNIARVMTTRDVHEIAARHATAHNVHTVPVRERDRSVALHPFRTRAEAEAFRDTLNASGRVALVDVVSPTPTSPWSLVLVYANGDTDTMPYPSRQAARDAGAWYRTHCEQGRPTTVVRTRVVKV